MAIKYLLTTPNADNTISSAEIAADAVIAAKIASDAITTAKISANAVTTAKIAALAVTSAEIAADAVIAAKIADGAVTEGKIGALAVTDGKIAANAVTGAKLSSDVDLPVGARLDGVLITDRITAVAGGYDFKESVVTLVAAAAGDLGTYNDSASVVESANLPDVPAYGFTIAEAALALNTAISANQNRALTDGDRVAFTVFASSAPVASKRTGIYTVTRGLGKGTSSAAYFYTFTRAADANSTTNFNLGALVYANSGGLSGGAVFLGAGTFNTTTALFTLLSPGVAYTAGNGIAISGGNAISVAADAGGPVTVSGSGVSVRSASKTESGVITSTQFKNLTRTVAASAESASATQTINLTPNSFMLPATAINTVVLVRAVVHSLSTTGAKHCVTEVRFALRRGASGNSVLIGDTVSVFKQGDASGITAMTVEGTVGTTGSGGEDFITITGVDTVTIDHNVVVTTQILPNTASN